MHSASRPAPEGRIGVISDTHSLLLLEAIEVLQTVERIPHTGDIGKPEHFDILAGIAPVTAIRGNINRGAGADTLTETATLTAGGLRIHMIHDRKALRADPVQEGWNIVISGHSHRSGIRDAGSVL